MHLAEKFSKLESFYKSLIPSLTEESWKVAESVLTIRTLKKGEYLVREGDICNHVSFVNHGLVRMFFLVGEREKIVRFTTENNYVSDYQSFLTRLPATTYVQALEPTELVETNYEDLQMLYTKVPEANKLGRMIAEQLFLEMCEASRGDANATLLQRYNRIVDEQPGLLQRVPQYMIASYLGITPEALSRIKSGVRRPKSALKAA